MIAVIKQELMPYELKKGECIVVDYNDNGRLGLIMCCPRCGETSASKDQKHTFNRETFSYTPSIIHDVELGGCGYHGYLTNGIFTDV